MQIQSTFCSSQQERGDKNLDGKKIPWFFILQWNENLGHTS
jgi:hypothetical protein